MKKRILMLGPARDVKGGMTSVVDNYYNAKLDKMIDLKYIETINDKGIISKIISEIRGKKDFDKNIRDYDIVHIHMASRRSTFRKGRYVRKAKKLNKKVILHIHGAEFKMFYNECNNRQKMYIKETLNLCDKIIVLSEEWKDYFDRLVKDKDKIVIIYNAISLPLKFKKNVDSEKILFLGRIGQRKGIYDLIDVINKIIIDFPSVKLYIGGDGEIEKLNKMIEKSENIKYIGWIYGKEKNKYLEESSFYILPSYNEGMPMSLIEGMAYENVVISTKVGGIPKIIDDNVNGFLIAPGDKKDLYNKLFILLKDKNLREKFSKNARKTVEEKFDIDKGIQKLINLYNEV